MKLPNWFTVGWWVLLLMLAGTYGASRRVALLSGQITAVDIMVVAAGLALVLLPLFQEVSIFGLSFKERIDGLKNEVASLRMELHSSVDVRNQFTPIIVPAPPPDSELPAIEQRIQHTLENALKSMGTRLTVAPDEVLGVSDDTLLLFRVRYNLERELRRMWQQRIEGASVPTRRFIPTLRIARALAESGLIDAGTEHAIREVWSVAAPGVHGEPVTAAQVAFVRDVAPRLISALKTVE